MRARRSRSAKKSAFNPSNGGARPHVDGSGKAEAEKKATAAQRRDSAKKRQRRGPEPAAPPLQKIPALGRNSGRNHYLCFRMAKKFGDKLRRFNPFTRPATLEEPAQTAAGQSRPAAGEGLRRRLRRRGLLARHLRPLPEPLPALRNLGAQPRRPSQGEEGADGDDPPLVGGA